MGFQHDPAAVRGGFQGVPHRLIEIARRIARRRLEAAVFALAICFVMMLLYRVIFRGGVEAVHASLRVSFAVIRRDGGGFMFGRGGGDIAALAHREMGVGFVFGIGHIMIGIVEIACFRSPIKAACLAMPMMCSAAAVGDQFLIGRMFVLTVCKGERPAFQRGFAPFRGGYRRAVKGSLVDMACAGQLDPINKFIGVPAVNLQLAAVDTKTRWIRTIRPDRRAIVQRVLDDQPSGISAAFRLSVNRIAAAAYQSALHRQLCALAENQSADAAYGQVSMNGYVASLNHVGLAVGKVCVPIAAFINRAVSAPTGMPYNIAIGINRIREDISAIRQRRRLAEPVGQRRQLLRVFQLCLLFFGQGVIIRVAGGLKRLVDRHGILIVHAVQLVHSGQGIDQRLNGGHGLPCGRILLLFFLFRRLILLLFFPVRRVCRFLHGRGRLRRPLRPLRQRRRGQQRQAERQSYEQAQNSFFHIFPP